MNTAINPILNKGMPRLLVIRGGALGDFILSLPVMAALKREIQDSQIEIMGYPRIAALAVERVYAEKVRSIDYGPLSRFYGADSDLPEELCAYFASFHQIISFFYDPDDIFHGNLRKAGARHILQLPHKPDENKPLPASEQFARGLEKIGIFPGDFAPRVYSTVQDQAEAAKILGPKPGFRVVIHPGSGSPSKNWPLENWVEIIQWLLKRTPAQIALVFGEVEIETKAAFARFAPGPRVKVLDELPLPVLAAALGTATVFVGHDSGISHLAAAVGSPVITLFGPTNPVIWAPPGACVIRKGQSLTQIVTEEVQIALAKFLRLG
ncbi:MAG: glycosyltransferase family 9 protein [Verrucomicrobiota bacterium]|nr:glycosyltransferase family 9 protein [Verrucomicrobiota bacterium]